MNTFVVCFLLWLPILQSSVSAHTNKGYVNPLEDCSTCPETKYLINYYARNCTAFNKYNCANCVMRFQCPTVSQQALIKEGCFYLGKRYEIGNEVKTRNPCEVCQCAPGLEDGSSEGIVRCTFVECPEMVFGYSAKSGNNESEKNCYFSYTHERCCGKRVCPTDDEMKNITLCKYKGKEFKAGEHIHPDEDKCKVCICDNHWNPEKLAMSESCRPIGCSYTLSEEQKLMRGCTPVFETDACCPSEFICRKRDLIFLSFCTKCLEITAEDKKTFDRPVSVDQKHDQQMCEFDGVKYKLGERLRTPNPCLNCTCLVPPLFTCIKETCPYQPCDGIFQEDTCCPINDCENHKKTIKGEPLLMTMKDSCFPPLQQLYTDMNCTAIGSPNCSTAYLCQKRSSNELTSGCFVEGKLFQIGDEIKTRNPCSMLRCGDSMFGYPHVEVSGYLECPSLFVPPLPQVDNQTCYDQYFDESCCGNNVCFSNDTLSTIKMCEFEGKQYKLGEKIYPSTKRCLRCLCTEDWETELGLNNPSCKPIACLPVTGIANRMQRGCAPVFETDSCCPDDYYCPANVQEKIPNPFRCLYQENEYMIGSKLLLTDKCITCNCTTPPVFSCEKMKNCTRVESVPLLPNSGVEEQIREFEYCELNGKIYNISDEINFPDSPCLQCNCGSIAGISCTYAECPEMVFGYPAIPQGGEKDPKFKNCYFEYELNQCCGKRKCPTDEELANQKKCVVNGTEYKLGQEIPLDKCKRCICSDDFDETNSNSNACRPIGCTNPESIKMISLGCTPIYKDGECCPVDYFCGTDKEPTILQEASILELNVDYRSEEMKCTFNGTKYFVGDRVKSNDICIRCSCQLPPLISCTREKCEPPPSSDCVPVYNTNMCCPTYDCPVKVTINQIHREAFKHKCFYPKIVELYTKLGCEAKTTDYSSCAYRFHCPNLDAIQSSTDSDDCHYLGKKYKVGDVIDVSDKCSLCRCGEKSSESDDNRLECVSPQCASVDIPSERKQDCYVSFESNKCCGDQVCHKSIETCNHEGKSYRLGEQIKLNQSLECIECFCTKGWNETDPESSPGCKRLQCPIYDHGNKMIRKGCVPVYTENNCCPREYFCPIETKITGISDVCDFKGRKYPLGSKLMANSGVDCVCKAPPSFTCKVGS